MHALVASTFFFLLQQPSPSLVSPECRTVMEAGLTQTKWSKK